MRIKLTTIIGVSLISLSVGFSALSNANARTCAEKQYDFLLESYEVEDWETRHKMMDYYVGLEGYITHCKCMYENRHKTDIEKVIECGLQPQPEDYGLDLIEVVFDDWRDSVTPKPTPVLQRYWGTSGGGSVYEEPTTSSSYPSPIITTTDGVVK